MVCRSLALGCAAALCLWLGMAAPAAAAQTPALLAAAQQAAVQAPELSLPCRAAVLIDQGTGTVLYEKNASQRAPIASITKVMTLLLTFEAIHDGRLTLDTPVPVSEHAASMGGSQIWIEPGEHFTWTRCCGPSVCPAPTTRPWRWPSWWEAARKPLWPR